MVVMVIVFVAFMVAMLMTVMVNVRMVVKFMRTVVTVVVMTIGAIAEMMEPKSVINNLHDPLHPCGIISSGTLRWRSASLTLLCYTILNIGGRVSCPQDRTSWRRVLRASKPCIHIAVHSSHQGREYRGVPVVDLLLHSCFVYPRW